MKAFARTEKETWRTDLAYVDEPANDNKCIKHLLVREDLFDRSEDAKGRKTKDSNEITWVCVTKNKQNIPSRENWVDK